MDFLEVLAKQKVIIIGAGPAGLTAGLHLLQNTNDKFEVLILESGSSVGGLSRTHNYKGNRMDIGGHRFFSKSDRVMKWWQEIMPIDHNLHNLNSVEISYQGKKKEVHIGSKSDKEFNEAKRLGRVMLIRNRLSRIYYLRRFFSYPINLSLETLRLLGPMRLFKIGISYMSSRLFPIRTEVSLQDFLINRFGKELYQTFFKDYTEKVWGVSCEKISAEWGAQRIKGLSITKAILHALNSKKKKNGISQKNTETSLIERFMYPRLGPGQMWELVTEKIIAFGGQIQLGVQVLGLDMDETDESRVHAVRMTNNKGQEEFISADYVISSMPIKDLILGINPKPDLKTREIANGLIYRDFITVGLLIKKFKGEAQLKDNWIYIQERDVKIGRLQIFNNWSPDLVENKENIWLGLEYFCQENDELWNLTEKEFFDFAVSEMVKLDLIELADVIDGTVLKVPKTYPAYFGSYDQFDSIIAYLNEIKNLFPIGRNGMHRYNNQDHSMLTGMMAAENIIAGITDKTEMWKINTEMEYHEEK